jgi:hypothetical protein
MEVSSLLQALVALPPTNEHAFNIEDLIGGHHSQIGRFKKLLLLSGIEPQILCFPSYIVVTTLNEIFLPCDIGISEKCEFYLNGLLKFLL